MGHHGTRWFKDVESLKFEGNNCSYYWHVYDMYIILYGHFEKGGTGGVATVKPWPVARFRSTVHHRGTGHGQGSGYSQPHGQERLNRRKWRNNWRTVSTFLSRHLANFHRWPGFYMGNAQNTLFLMGSDKTLFWYHGSPWFHNGTYEQVWKTMRFRTHVRDKPYKGPSSLSGH
jgi:hypothetical protein